MAAIWRLLQHIARYCITMMQSPTLMRGLSRSTMLEAKPAEDLDAATPLHRSHRRGAGADRPLAVDRHPEGGDRCRDRAPGFAAASAEWPPPLPHRPSA